MNRLSPSLPSIAVSVVVKPSKILTCIVVVYCLALFGVAAAILFSFLGDLSHYARGFVASITFLAIAIALVWLICQRKITRLDISMNAQIRLVEHNGLAGLPFSNRDKPVGNHVWRLKPDSVLWSGMLLLRLETEAHHSVTLLILRDSISTQAFRTLSVACRWIAAQNNPANGELI